MSNELSANELRIGNLIYNTRGNVDIVTIDALIYLINYPNTLCQASPIPLTEELLVKFGFEIMYNSDFSMKYGHTINDIFSYKFNLVDGKSWLEYNGVAIKCKYVHQLQNLYYALTQTELIIKL